MKIFKRVYYPIMAALTVLMLVLGIVDARVGMGGKLSAAQSDAAVSYAREIAAAAPHNSYDTTRQTTVRDIIVRELTDSSYDYRAQKVPALTVSDDTDEDGNNTVDYFTRTETDGTVRKVPSVYVQKATVRAESQPEGGEVAVSRTVENVILAIPGQSDDAILLHARYDGSAIGGASDAAATGALLETAVHMLKNNTTPRNTVVFLFGDAGQEGDLGACAFLHQFAGFDNVTAKLRAVADFSVGGTGGTLTVYGSSGGSLDLMGKYARFNGGTFASSALPLLFKRSDYNASGTFGDYNTLTFTNRGGFNEYATANDTEVNETLTKQQGTAMHKFLDCYAGSDVSKMDADASAVYFSYLDVMTVYYPVAVAFVIAGIILGLLIAIIILNVRNKVFSWSKVLAGVAVQLVTLAATSLVALALYYLFALLLSGFGVVPFHGLSAIRYAGTGLLLSASALAIVFAIFFYILLMRTFALRAANIAHGNALLFTAVAAVLSFAAPGISYPFTCVAIFALLAMLATVLFKNKFNKKFTDENGVKRMVFNQLFLYVWAIVFSLPLFMPLFVTAQTLFPAVSIVLILAIMVGLSGFIAPFADSLKPCIDKVFKKLPPHTVRYERTVTEMVEDRAKKGKFTEQTVKKIEKEQVPWTYHNRIGLSFVAVIGAALVVLFCAFGSSFSSTALAAPSYYDSMYDDSLILVYEKTDSVTDVSVQVRDQIAYNYLRYAVGDLSWDASERAYTKEFTGDINKIMPSPSDFTVSGDEVRFTLFDSDYSQTSVRLTNAASVKSVQFNVGDENRESEKYEFDGREEILFRLPYGYEDFTMTVEGSCEIQFEQHVYNSANLQGIDDSDWDKMYDYYGGNDEVGPALRSGIVIRVTKSK